MNAADVMTLKVLSVGPGTSVAEAVRLMLNNNISGLPVVDSADRLVGIVTEGDFLRRA
jgi:CBS domain-containing protein